MTPGVKDVSRAVCQAIGSTPGEVRLPAFRRMRPQVDNAQAQHQQQDIQGGRGGAGGGGGAKGGGQEAGATHRHPCWAMLWAAPAVSSTASFVAAGKLFLR